MEDIRDDGFQMNEAPGWDDVDDLLRTIRVTIDKFTIDRQQGQERRIVLWCEAAGMVPQLQRVANDYSVPVYSSGGFDSITSKHTIGKEFGSVDSLVLHLGDLDPSGEHIYSSLAEDIKEFSKCYGGEPEFIRLAVTREQVKQYDLPTSPPKARDNRSFDGDTTQCESLPPRILAEIVPAAIEGNLDMEQYQAVVEREGSARAAD